MVQFVAEAKARDLTATMYETRNIALEGTNWEALRATKAPGRGNLKSSGLFPIFICFAGRSGDPESHIGKSWWGI